MNEEKLSCPFCTSSRFKKHGSYYAKQHRDSEQLIKVQRYHCECGYTFTQRTCYLIKEKKKIILSKEKEEEIIEYIKNGKSLRQAERRFGITRYRIKGIVEKN